MAGKEMNLEEDGEVVVRFSEHEKIEILEWTVPGSI